MKNIIEIGQLSWDVEGRSILSGVDFSLAEGQMLGLIGPNGAGKSSLLRCLYRYIKPGSGQIRLFGEDISELSARELARRVAVVQQESPHYFELSTAQLVAMGLTPHKGLFDATTAADREAVEQALQRVGLADRSGQRYESLSGGEKQRALIARAIVQRPQLLILDEPTNHLDIRYQIQILELVRSLGISVIASIHDLNLASALCDSLLLLHGGKVCAQGRPEEVLTEARIAQVFGVCCRIGPHPQHGRPLISYFYGYPQTGAASVMEAAP